MTLQPLLPAPGPPAAAGAGPADPTADGLATGTAFGAALAALVGAVGRATAPDAAGAGPDTFVATRAEGDATGGCLPGGAELAVLAQLAGLGTAVPPAPAPPAGHRTPLTPDAAGGDAPLTAAGPIAAAVTAPGFPPPAPASPLPGAPGNPAAGVPAGAAAPVPLPASAGAGSTDVGEVPGPTGPAGRPQSPAPAPAIAPAGLPAEAAPPAAVPVATAGQVVAPDAGARGGTTSAGRSGDPGAAAAAYLGTQAAAASAATGTATGTGTGTDTGAGGDGTEGRPAPGASAAEPATTSAEPAATMPPAAPSAAPAAAPTAGTGDAAGAGEARAGTAGPPVAVPDQVLRHLTSVRALHEGGHRTVLRLDPEHLGEVTLTVDVRAGSVRLAVSGGAEAVGAVQAGLASLRSSLAESGLALGDVALRPDAAAAAVPSGPTGTGPDDRDPGSRPSAGPDGALSGGPGQDRPATGREDGRERRDGPAPDLVPASAAGSRPEHAATGIAGAPHTGRLDVRV